ncbi:MAG: hypothetical protein C4327_00445 [Meiothermus sp.]
MTYTVTDYVAVRRLRDPAIRRRVTRLEVILPSGQPSTTETRLNQALRSGTGVIGLPCAAVAYLAICWGLGEPLLEGHLLWGLLSLGGGLALARGLMGVYRELLWRQVLRQLEHRFDRRSKPRPARHPSRPHDRRPDQAVSRPA